MTSPFALLATARPTIADGAMGTALFSAGMPVGLAPEAWILTPEGVAAVTSVHAGHIAAGSRLILTCTFGANALRLAGSEAEGRTGDVCRAAVAAARAAIPTAGHGDAVIVAGSMGPTGGLMQPYGTLDAAAVRDNYAEQAAALAEAGVDVLWVETMVDLAEALAAVDGAREGARDVPVVATLTFDRGRTMFGQFPEPAAAALAEHGVAGVGANCGNGFEPVEVVLAALAAGAPGLHLVAKANAGIPVGTADGSVRYPATPDEARGYARRVLELGATIVGGCCGTTAAHVAQIADEVAKAAASAAG